MPQPSVAPIMHLLALSCTLTTWLLAFATFLGLGRATARALRMRFPAHEQPFSHVWLGWAVSLIFLQLWHLFLPIDWRAGLCLGVPGLVWSAPAVRRLWHRAGRTPRGYAAISAALLVLAGGWFAARGMLAPTVYDSGLYHFNAIRWLNEHQIPPGLGNLHGRLAYNQSYFCYPALLNLYPFFNRGHNAANSLLFFLLLAECLLSVLRALRNRRGRAAPGWRQSLPMLFLPLLLFTAATTSLSAPTPDCAGFLLQIVLFLHLWRLLRRRSSARGIRSEAGFVILVSAVSVTVKLSNAVYAMLCATVAVAFACTALRRSATSRARCLAPVLSVSGFCLLLSLCRSMLLSGYPLYPLTVARIPVDWAVPLDAARSEARSIAAWARNPTRAASEVLDSRAWFAPWLKRTMKKQAGCAVSYPVLLFGVFTAMLACAAATAARRGRARSQCVYLPATLPALGGLAYWFVAAPDPRFAGAQFWILAVAAGATLLAYENGRIAVMPRTVVVFVGLGLPFLVWFLKHPDALARVSTAGYQPLPRAELSQQTTDSGLTLFVPVVSDQCWDSPLPSTPHFNPHLSLRDTSLSRGFKMVPPRPAPSTKE